MRLLALLLLLQDPDMKSLLDLRRTLREVKAASAAAHLAAHDALDASEYEKAITERDKASKLDAQARALLKREEAAATAAANALVKSLMSDDIDVRERAAMQLVVIGPCTIKLLEAVRKDGDLEVKGRIDRVLKLLREIEVDDDGRLRQWAISAKASTEYSEDPCGAKQVLGKPDTTLPGDQRTAWAPSQQDAGEEWIELGYEAAVRPARVRIRENCGCGAVVKIEAQDAEGKWHVLWKGTDPTKEGLNVFDPEFESPAFATKRIRVTLDTSLVAGWNEIDAVELVGEPGGKKK